MQNKLPRPSAGSDVSFVYRDWSVESMNIQIAFLFAEERRLAKNYLSEADAIHHMLPSNSSTRHSEPTLINRPILPCNFLPIEAHHFTGEYF